MADIYRQIPVYLMQQAVVIRVRMRNYNSGFLAIGSFAKSWHGWERNVLIQRNIQRASKVENQATIA